MASVIRPATAVALCIYVLLLVACGGGGSNSPAPTQTGSGLPPTGNQQPGASIAGTNPSLTYAGNASFKLSVIGSNFVQGSTVLWNGQALPSTVLGSTVVTADVDAALIATPSTVSITVANPSSAISNASQLQVAAQSGGPISVSILNVPAANIIWDALHQVIYASVPHYNGQFADSVVAIDPTTGKVLNSVPAGSNPNQLAIARDDSFLYVGEDGTGSIQRFRLPSLSPDLTFSLGTNPQEGNALYFAESLSVAPGAPHTLAVSLATHGFTPISRGVVIYDDNVARPNPAPSFLTGFNLLYDSITWGTDSSFLYAANNEDTGFNFYILPVSASGIGPIQDHPSSFRTFHELIHFDEKTGYIYGDEGTVIDPKTGSRVGSFAAGGIMTPDSTSNAAFFVTFFQSDPLGTVTLSRFDLTQRTLQGFDKITNENGVLLNLIRCGSVLAFNVQFDDGSYAIYFVRGSFVQ